MNLTRCYGFPMYISMKDFYGAPEYAKNQTLIGLNPPDMSRNPFIMWIEPTTGVIFFASAGMQLNIPMFNLPATNQCNLPSCRGQNVNNIPDQVMVPYLTIYKKKNKSKKSN